MPQKQIKGQRQYHSPRKYQLSSMIQASDAELEQLIHQEAERNMALEVLMPDDAGYESADAPTSSDYGDDQGADSGFDSTQSADGALTDEQRGDKVTLDNDDDEAVCTTSQPSDDNRGLDIFSATASDITFREDLKQQINELDIEPEERYLAHYLIDCLEDDGYLRRPLSELVDDLEFNQHHVTTEEELEAVLVEVVQEELDPAGIGARDLRECLLLQLQARKASPATLLAYEIVDKLFDDLVAKHYDTIQEAFGITRHQALVEAIRVIRHLNPKPGNMEPVTEKSNLESRQQQVRPDFIIRNEEGHFVVTLNDSQMPQVRISADEQRLCDELQQRVDGADPKTANAQVLQDTQDGLKLLREKIQDAHDFIHSLEQRRVTLLSVIEVLVRRQRAFFLTGQIETLQPMTLQDVADDCQYDISTISRVTSSKYADTEFGILALRDLFTNAVGDSSQAAVKEALRAIIEGEDKQNPYVDDRLVTLLSDQGFKIARRTVVKYREMMGYPSARERRQLP